MRRIVERFRDWRAGRRRGQVLDFAALDAMRRDQPPPRITQPGDKNRRLSQDLTQFRNRR